MTTPSIYRYGLRRRGREEEETTVPRINEVATIRPDAPWPVSIPSRTLAPLLVSVRGLFMMLRLVAWGLSYTSIMHI